MSKVEPASIKRIKELVENYHNEYTLMSVILAWIRAEALTRQGLSMLSCPDSYNCNHAKFDDYLAAVKAEVGWPED